MLLKPAQSLAVEAYHTKCYLELIIIFMMDYFKNGIIWVYSFVTSHNAKDNCCFLPFLLSAFFLSFLQQIFFGDLLCVRYFDRFGRITNNKTDKVSEI